MNFRVVKHFDGHYDIEKIVKDETGKLVWAVIYCNEKVEKMVQASQDNRPANYGGGHIQDLSPVMGAAEVSQMRSDEMNETTATNRKEWLEDKKDELDTQIAALCVIRERAENEGNWKLYELIDKGIDDLLLDKDNLTSQPDMNDPRTADEKARDEEAAEWEADRRDLGEWARGR